MRKILKIQLLLIILSLAFVSCEDWLDVNEDPNNAQQGKVELLLPSAQAHLFTYFGGYDSDASVGNTLGTLMHQIMGNGNHYDVKATDHTVEQPFSSMFSGGLKDIEEIIRIGTENGDMKYVGIAKILKAYTYSIYVDLWGNIPFSEACKMPEVSYPKYESGDIIYPQLFKLIDEGVANINDVKAINSTSIGSADLVYKGQTSYWIKLANTLKLNMYNKIRLHSSFDVSALTALINENNFIDADCPFEMNYYDKKLPQNRNPVYKDEYGDTTSTAYVVSPWIYKIMTGGIGTVFAGMADPRIAYYFYNQENGSSTDDVDYNVGDFYSYYFGSHRKEVNSNFKNYTSLGVYPCGGKYDDGSKRPGDDANNDMRGSGLAPNRLFSYHDLLYVKSELALVGKITANVWDLFESAMEASFKKVNDIAALDSKAPALLDADRDSYIAAIKAKYDVATDEQKMELIITEKWIAAFGNPLVSYNDYRRTGYPTLFDPASVGDAEVYVVKSFPVSLPYANSSMTANQNAPKEQKVIATDKVFWDVN